ncbi:hypothetical protein BJ085DRAFT_34200 [Dimargaris cristalligena]|uniref:F-box domain-containing protein n=1 Tax=Dimargaris cristalligena TaxID=215637 RepID=A0A4P9ZN70_9FUNG|nr:hypothetical protein BJ085DRAFT_34200 [Dimargaris cristalligena]|eukprot:RKP33760.1 hypothetical protein BJ085DRAFT_34200 [Dimargaris cristalligena]
MADSTNDSGSAPLSNLSGEEFLAWILHPSQQHIGKLVIQRLDNQDQFNLASTCHALRPLVAATYELSFEIPTDISKYDCMERFIERHRPKVRHLHIQTPPEIPLLWIVGTRFLFKSIVASTHLTLSLEHVTHWPILADCLTSFGSPLQELQLSKLEKLDHVLGLWAF